MNETKTEFIVFTKSTKMIQRMNNDMIAFNGETFSWKDSVNYLGVILDRKLNFKHHIENSIRKASAASFSSLYCLLSRNSHVSVDFKLRIYKSYIRPIITYACPIFANAAACHLKSYNYSRTKSSE